MTHLHSVSQSNGLLLPFPSPSLPLRLPPPTVCSENLKDVPLMCIQPPARSSLIYCASPLARQPPAFLAVFGRRARSDASERGEVQALWRLSSRDYLLLRRALEVFETEMSVMEVQLLPFTLRSPCVLAKHTTMCNITKPALHDLCFVGWFWKHSWWIAVGFCGVEK